MDYLKWMPYIGFFIFVYPVIMSTVWIIGGMSFWHRRENKASNSVAITNLPATTILVPCHNEEVCIKDTFLALNNIEYPDYRVVFIDDASTDRTVKIIKSLIKNNPNFHLLQLSHNQGKARALNYGLFSAVSTSITIIIDADTAFTPDALTHLVTPFLQQPRMGAVTGNPLVANRHNILEKLQAAEFVSIVGLIKRAQRSLGRILTVSGCVASYNTELLKEIGGFSTLTATEDIDITWQIQRRFHEVWFAPGALVLINAPSTIREFWKQRCRWAEGGWHLLRTHRNIFTRFRWRRLWPVYIEQVISNLWSICFVFGSLLWLLTYYFTGDPIGFPVIPAWYGGIISVICMTQFGVALIVSRRFDSKLWKIFFWIPWYPLFYFCIGALAVVRTSIKGLFGDLEQAGKWKSPVREKLKHVQRKAN